MDGLTFTAEIIKALVWPFAVIIAILIMRKPLADLVMTLRLLRYRDFRLEFGRKLEELEAGAEQAHLPLPEAAQQRARHVQDEEGLGEYVKRLAHISPRAAIAESWRHIELAIRDAARRTDQPEPRSFQGLAGFFETQPNIPREAVTLFRNLRDLRNQAVHAHGADFELGPEQAAEFGRIAERLIAALRA